MGVTVDVDGLERLRADFEKIDVDDIMRKSANIIMQEMLKEVIKATPEGKRPDNIQMFQKVKVRTGELKKNGKPKTKTLSFYTMQGLAWRGYRGGTLKKGWQAAQNSYVHYGNVYSLTATNATEYSDYVNLGHRQHKGRFVPAIGKRLVRSYVPGRHFTQDAEEKVQPKAEKIVNKFIEKALQDAVSQE